MLALLLMAMPENSVSKGTLHLEDEATERDSVNTSRLGTVREWHQAPGGVGLLGQCPNPVYCAPVRHGWTGMLIAGSGGTDRVCTTLVLLSVHPQFHVC